MRFDSLFNVIETKIAEKATTIRKDKSVGPKFVFMDDIHDVLKELLGSMELTSDENWIPCSDHQPTEFERYLVTCKGIEIPQIRLFEGYWDSTHEVIAWQPLPRKYDPSKAVGDPCDALSKFHADAQYLKECTGYRDEQIGCFLCNYDDPNVCGRFNSSGCRGLAGCKALYTIQCNKK